MRALLGNLATGRVSAFVGDLLETLSSRGRGRGRGETIDAVLTAEALLSRRGEASGVMLARLVLEAYAAASPDERSEFLRALAIRFGADPKALDAAVAAYSADPGPKTAQRLADAAEPRRREVLRRLNLAPGGTKALVAMREDLMARLKADPDLRLLDADFAHLFASWFNRGFLTLRPIDWQTSAAVLEKIIRYEAVHVIKGWDDLRTRLAPPDRRCFAFFHPRLPDEPLIFVEVALTAEIPATIDEVLTFDRDPIDAEEATTAVFYSISNTQPGLGGVTFGNFLIKQVVEDLRHALPDLRTFVTLSPVPGFAAWLAAERADPGSEVLGEAERRLLEILDEPDWHLDLAKAETLRRPLLGLAAHYFLVARRPDGRLHDPVARFHLGNGARLERLNWRADLSENGLVQSHGLMVNYLYALDDIERNHEAFVERGTVAASTEVRKRLPAEVKGRVRAR